MTKRFQLTAHSPAFQRIQEEGINWHKADGIKATASGDTFEECIQHLQTWANVEGKDLLDWTITVVDTLEAAPAPSGDSYYDQPTTLAEIEATIHRYSDQTQAERRFLSRIAQWTEKGARFTLRKSFNPYDGHSFSAFFYATNLLSHSSVSMSWNLKCPFTRTRKGSFTRKTAVRFFSSYGTEQDCSWTARGIFEVNARNLDWHNNLYPDSKMAVDGMALDEPSTLSPEVNALIDEVLARPLPESVTVESGKAPVANFADGTSSPMVVKPIAEVLANREAMTDEARTADLVLIEETQGWLPAGRARLLPSGYPEAERRFNGLDIRYRNVGEVVADHETAIANRDQLR